MKGLIHEIRKQKPTEETSINSEVFFKWVKEVFTNPNRSEPEIKPDKICFKFPMSKRVMDIQGRFFAYDFYAGKIKYTYIGSGYIEREAITNK